MANRRGNGKNNMPEHFAYKYWQNMMNGKCYVKGEHDSKTKKYVLATRVGNYFSEDTCYFSLVKDLPIGTVYVDGE